jgi:hypothetical protein
MHQRPVVQLEHTHEMLAVGIERKRKEIAPPVAVGRMPEGEIVWWPEKERACPVHASRSDV